MERKDLLYLSVFALLLFLFGSWLMPVTDPVESNYVETAKDMPYLFVKSSVALNLS